MPRARAIGINPSRSRSATSTRRSPRTAGSSPSNCAAASELGWRSSTSATSSSRWTAGRRQPPDDERHFGLVVDDRDAVRAALDAAGVEILPGRGLDFRDPWGNRFEIVQYDEVQFTKAPEVARGMGVEELEKTEAARDELLGKGMA